MLSNSFNYLFPLFAPILAKEPNVPIAWVPLIQGCIFFASGVFQPRLGKLLDTGMIRTFVFLCVGLVISPLLYFLFISPNWILTSVFFLILMLGTGATSTIVMRTLVAASPDHLKARMASIAHMIENVGVSISAITAFYLLSGYKNTLITLDLITTLALVLFASFQLGTMNRQSETSKAPVHDTPTKSGRIKVATASRAALLASLSIVLLFTTITAQLSAIPALMRMMGFDPERATALVFFVSALVTALTSAWIFFKKPDLSRTFIPGAILMSIGHVLLPFVTNLFGISVCAFLWSFGEAFLVPWTVSVFFLAFPSTQHGQSSGLLVFLRRFSLVVSAFLALVIQWLPAYSFGIIFGLIPLLIILTLNQSKNKVEIFNQT